MVENNIKQKDEVEIDESNLKDFLERDLKGIEFILNESEEFISDLSPEPISKSVKKSNCNDSFDYYKKRKKV